MFWRNVFCPDVTILVDWVLKSRLLAPPQCLVGYRGLWAVHPPSGLSQSACPKWSLSKKPEGWSPCLGWSVATWLKPWGLKTLLIRNGACSLLSFHRPFHQVVEKICKLLEPSWVRSAECTLWLLLLLMISDISWNEIRQIPFIWVLESGLSHCVLRSKWVPHGGQIKGLLARP